MILPQWTCDRKHAHHGSSITGIPWKDAADNVERTTETSWSSVRTRKSHGVRQLTRYAGSQYMFPKSKDTTIRFYRIIESLAMCLIMTCPLCCITHSLFEVKLANGHGGTIVPLGCTLDISCDIPWISSIYIWISIIVPPNSFCNIMKTWCHHSSTCVGASWRLMAYSWFRTALRGAGCVQQWFRKTGRRTTSITWISWQAGLTPASRFKSWNWRGHEVSSETPHSREGGNNIVDLHYVVTSRD